VIQTLVLDSEGLSRTVRRNSELHEWLIAAERENARLIVSTAALVEASDPRIPQARFDWTVSRMHIEPVSEAISRHASRLLAAAGLHGRKYAIDAVVAATALSAPDPTLVLTSDTEDLMALCGERVRVHKI
jgi:predicted nucleic acid-binding protein